MNRNLVIALLLVLFIPVLASAQLTEVGKTVREVTNVDIDGITYWSSDTIWVMDGVCYVEDGEVLIIEAGTIIKAKPGQTVDVSALVVTRGGRIYAEGTQCNPIIFTAEADNLDDAGDIPLPPSEFGRALWGGVVIMGHAEINDPSGWNYIEGLEATDPRNQYGGSDDDDNSGILKYVSIRHGGSKFSDANEINGLTLGGVGRGTTIDYIEVFANLDDGIEFFGGTAQVKHFISAFGGDDDVDYDEGFRGALQYVFTIKDTVDSDKAGEHDGGGQGDGVPDDVEPYGTPCISNVTYLGAGNPSGSINSGCFNIRDNAGGAYVNSILGYHKGTGIKVEDLASGHDSRERLSVGDLHFQNNLWWENLGGLYSMTQTWVIDSVFGDGTAGKPDRDNDELNPVLAGIDWDPNGNLDPRPSAAGPATRYWIDPLSVYNPPANPGLNATWTGFFETVDYIGAFDPNGDLWCKGWTAVDHYGYLVDEGIECLACQSDDNKPVIVTTNADVDGFTVWSRENVYNLSGVVYVEDTDTLLVEPGTIIKSNSGSHTNVSALVVTRGSLAYMVGSRDCPIVMTSISDDTDDQADIPLPPSEFGRGLWGGLVVLGESIINDPNGWNYIEGLEATDPRNQYGGTDDCDSSGVFKYVSIRHGGSKFSDANEINGLTLGAVGSGTVIDYIEVFANLDDGVEFFGGTARVSHAALCFGGDDDVDYDEGFRGSLQFVFAIKDTVDSDKAGEHDGGGQGDGVPDDVEPYAVPLISNATYVGAGNPSGSINSGCFNIRDNAGGGYFNSIFAYHKGTGIKVEDLPTGHDSRERLEACTPTDEADLKFENNMWWSMLGGNYSVSQTWVEDYIFSTMVAYGRSLENNETDPGISPNWDAVGECDPVPDGSVAQVGTWIDPVANFNPCSYTTQVCDRYMQTVDYVGAFDPDIAAEDSWLADWTFFDRGGYLGSSSSCDCGVWSDVTGDGAVNPVDVVFMVNYVYKANDMRVHPPACPLPTGDVTCDGAVNPVDVVFYVNYVYKANDMRCPDPCL